MRTLRQTVWYGYGDTVYGPISPALTSFYTADVPRYPHDPRLANDLLDAAGRPRGVDGTRFRVALDYRPWTEGDKRTAEYLRQALARVGIDATVRSQDFAALCETCLYRSRIRLCRQLDDQHVRSDDRCAAIVLVEELQTGVPFSNASHYMNPELDQALEAASVETDPARRRDLFVTLQQTVARDLPDISFLTDHHYSLFNRRVFDHTTQATGISSNLADVWLG